MSGLLTDARVRELVGTTDAIRLVGETFAAAGRGEVATSSPPALGLPLGAGAAKIKAAALPGLAGVRIAANVGSGLVSHCVLVDPADGRVRAVVEETWLHRLRTAASAAVVAGLLHRGEQHLAVALIGTGAIADELPAALATTTAVAELRVAARSQRSADAYAARHEGTAPMPVRACPSVAAAVAGADVVILLTNAREPVLDAAMLRPGTTVLGLGGGAELATDVLDAADRFFVDDLDFALSLGSVAGWVAAGLDPAIVRTRLTGSVGDLATGAVPGRRDPAQTVLAVVQGLAACDVALAGFAWERAG